MAETTLVADRTGELRMTPAAKQERYREVAASIEAILDPERDLLACMASVVCLLHNAFPYFFWTGFYRRVGAKRLLVGPYQGTMGCLEIEFGRGVCGTVASERQTRVVDNVNAFPGHIACDSASASEIVLPVFDAAGELIGVFDVDSTLPAAFDDVDREWLERILGWLAPKQNLPLIATAG
jgi:L-methionine (R)-S-oxide reductase